MKNVRLNQLLNRQNSTNATTAKTPVATVTAKCPFGKSYGQIRISFIKGKAYSE